ncbi:MAG: hypothetical protein JNK78_17730, partial [Planctomycetes bacterium]|nr:hypothetical protein [Planctomycetota bacterium]
INQAQIFGEVYRLIRRKDAQHRFKDGRGWNKDRGYGLVRDTLKALRTAFGTAWGDNKNHMVTRDVTIGAMLRMCGDVAARIDATIAPGADLLKLLESRCKPIGEIASEFGRDGFYERFPARGQLERIDVIKKRLARQARFE